MSLLNSIQDRSSIELSNSSNITSYIFTSSNIITYDIIIERIQVNDNS